MRRAHFILLSVAVVVAAAGAWWWRAADARAAWSAGVAPMPDLSAFPADLQRRVSDLTQRARTHRGDVSALGELSRLYDANGFRREAALAYVCLERFDPTNARWPHRLAHVLAGMGRIEQAVPHLRRAADLAPDYVPAWVQLGDALLKANQPEAAAAAYHAALKLAPGNPYALLGLARGELQLERWTAARERLQQASAAQPDFGVAWNLLATVYDRLGNAAGAAAAQAHADNKRRFREMPDPWVDELLDDCYDVYRLRVVAAAARGSGDPAGALPWLERAKRLAPDAAAVHRDLGDVFTDLHRYDDARAELQAAIRLAPTDETGYAQLIACCTAAGDSDGALHAAKEGVAHCPDSADLQFALGKQLETAGRLDEALPAFAAARRLQPESADAYHEMAGIYFRQGRNDEGIAVLEAVLEHIPDHPPTLLALAQREIETGDASAAVKWLQRARARGALAAGGVETLSRAFEKKFGRPPW